MLTKFEILSSLSHIVGIGNEYDEMNFEDIINQQDKQEKLLELYKAFYNSFKPTIEYEEEYNEEYLDIGGATCETIEIVKQIKELEE